MQLTKVAKIFDTLRNRYWTCSEDGNLWQHKNAAKLVWELDPNVITKGFSTPDQTRFVIHEFDLVRRLDKDD